MASRNADRQRRYRQRQRLKERGLMHMQCWVTPEQAEAIRRIMAERAGDVLAEGRQGRRRETACSNQNPA